MHSKKESGILYIVTTHKSLNYASACIKSARSSLRINQDINIHIISDDKGVNYIKSKIESTRISYSVIDNSHYRSKVDHISNSPFHRTLYLDTDTKIVKDISHLFDLLNRFDIALAHAHRRNHFKVNQVWNEKIPTSFPQFNGGVILFKKNKKVLDLLNKWSFHFHNEEFRKDQVTLRELLWKSDLRIATLPPEYNVRYSKYLLVWERKEAVPYIKHMYKYHNKSAFSKIKRILKKWI